MSDNEFIMISGVRVSFPRLFSPEERDGKVYKCGATLLLDAKKHAKAIAQIEASIGEMAASKFKGRKLPSDKLCLRDGNDQGRPEYEEHLTLSTNSRTRPIVLRGDGKTRIEDEADSAIYAGCYVNAKVRLWAQDNKYGKRINAELIAIQFHSDDEPLDGSYVSEEDAVSGFDAVDGDNDDFLAA